MKHLFFTRRVYFILGVAIVLFAASYKFGWLYTVAQVLLTLGFIALVVDVVWLFHPKVRFEVRRVLPNVFSLSDNNRVHILIKNLSASEFSFDVIDEIPFQFQKRDFEIGGNIGAGQQVDLQYELQPKVRGEYEFGAVLLFIKSTLGLVERRIAFELPQTIAVYPSIIQMKKYALFASEKISVQQGIKRLRKIGHSYEFEQIKEYVNDDDHRNINWKASSRLAKLMVNQYEMEKSQQIYCVIDKSRNMLMPFNGMSLMDYAINTTLTLCNVALQKHDKAGLITFSDKIGAAVKADSQSRQLHRIIEVLYREEERQVEANYELLHQIAQKIIKGRSLFLLFMNFENPQALDRVLPFLRRINHTHLLLVVFFENTEILEYAHQEAQTLEGIYQQTIAQRVSYEKQQMVNSLRQYGIQAVLSKPEELSVNTVNKYLELKARGMI